MISSQINEKLKEIHQIKLKEIESIFVDTLPARKADIYSFCDRLAGKKDLALIAEIKKASPSKGLIRENFDLDNIISDYKSLPADAISVLTDQRFFKGHADYLRHARANTSIPVLRKDFIISEQQIHESYSMGADMILLIVAMLSFDQLKSCIELTNQIGMEALVETHTQPEIEMALAAGAKIIGINNRDLNTFKVDINNALQLVEYIPDDVIKIAESGIHSADDIKRIEHAGFNAVLIGEAFMASADIPATYKKLFGK